MAVAHLIVLFLAVLAIASPTNTVNLFKKPLPKQVIPKVPQLPNSRQFTADNGTRWHIKYVGDIKFTGSLGARNLRGDVCRSSVLAGRHIWNCGDMQCGASWKTCGIADGPAFYGIDVMTINASAFTYAPDYIFVQPWAGDPKPVPPENGYGHGTSNVVSINNTHGLAISNVYTRGFSPNGTVVQTGIGNTIVAVTLGKDKPIGTRLGPAFTGADAIFMAGHSIIKADGWIYIYTSPNWWPGQMVVGRVKANFEAANDASQYEYLTFASSNTSNTSKHVWLPGVPTKANVTEYGMTAADGLFYCTTFGSIFWNNYLKKYMMMCNTWMSNAWFLLADKPYGPWSTNYHLFGGIWGYAIDAHPEYSPNGDHRTLYFSQSPNCNFTTFRVDFKY